jgi:calcineurin-like phosphoesterase family protein
MYWAYNIHGHIHENVVRKFANVPVAGRDGEADPRYINACMEHIGFTPIAIEELVRQRANWHQGPALPNDLDDDEWGAAV